MYQSKIAQFAAAGVSQAIVNQQVEAQAASGRVPAPAIAIAAALNFELPAKPAALILALNAAENARPFNTQKGHALLVELFAMAQAIVDSGAVKNLPALVLPVWATDEARAEAATKKAVAKAAKGVTPKAVKVESEAKSAAKSEAPAVTIATLDSVKYQALQLTQEEKEALLQFVAESLGLEANID